MRQDNIFRLEINLCDPRSNHGCYDLTPMTSSCAVRRGLAAEFAFAARLFAESAVLLATSGKSGIEYTSLCDQISEAQASAEAAFRTFTEHVASHHCGEATQDGQVHLYAQEQNAP
jgi:hypothetical protein